MCFNPYLRNVKTNQLQWNLAFYNVVNIIESHVTFRQQNWTKNGFNSIFSCRNKMHYNSF